MAASRACHSGGLSLQGLSSSSYEHSTLRVAANPLQSPATFSQSQVSRLSAIRHNTFLPSQWKSTLSAFGVKPPSLQRTNRGPMRCQAVADTDYTPFEERARIEPCEQAPELEDLLSGRWMDRGEQQQMLVAERLALGVEEIEDELLAPERLREDEIVEFQEDPNVALIINLEGDLVGTYIGSEQAVAWVKTLEREQAVAWFWNRLEEDNYRRFMAKGGDWWRGEEWGERPPHWYEYTRKDGKRVVWGQRKRVESHSVEDYTTDTLERVARFLVFHEEGKGSLASQPEGSLGRYLRDRILESKACWLTDGTISPTVAELEAGDENWSEYMGRKWKEFKNGFTENTYDAWRQGVAIDDRVGQQYYVPKKFGWKGPVHRTM